MAARERGAASQRTSAGRARKDRGEERDWQCGTAAEEEGEAAPARERTMERRAAGGAERPQRKGAA